MLWEFRDYVLGSCRLLIPPFFIFSIPIGLSWTSGAILYAAFSAYAHQLQHDPPPLRLDVDARPLRSPQIWHVAPQLWPRSRLVGSRLRHVQTGGMADGGRIGNSTAIALAIALVVDRAIQLDTVAPW